MKSDVSITLPKLNNVESLRFIFSLMIVYMHFTHEPAVKALYLIQSFNNEKLYLIVEFFFIIAGFFLFHTFKNKEQGWTDFVKKKILRLWPALACFGVVSIILRCFGMECTYIGLDIQIINMMFLQGIGVTPGHYGFNWFVSAYFWAIIFYFYILKNFNTKYANLIIALCVYFSLVGNLNHSDFTLAKIDTYNTFLSAGLLRAITGIGIGYFVGIFYDKIKERFCKEGHNSLKTFVLCSMTEILCSFFLIKNLLLKHTEKNALIFIVAFLILFFMFLLKKGVISKILDNKYLAFFGKYSYSIYVMQAASFCLLRFSLWKMPYFIVHTNILTGATLAFATILGILTYHLIEKPAAKYFNHA